MPTPVKVLTDADIDQLDLQTDDVLEAVGKGLLSQSQGTALAEPTISFEPLPEQGSLLSVVRGSDIGERLALIKTVGTFPGNSALGLPTNPGLVLLLNAETGQPMALLGASRLTTIRTAAVTALGAKLAARPDSHILGCIGSRGIALQAAEYIAQLFELSEIRIHSRNRQSVLDAAKTLGASLEATVEVCEDWESCLSGADIMIDGASHSRHETMFPLDVLKPGATLLAYGAYGSAVADTILKFDRIITDRWVDGGGGAFGPSIVAGHLTENGVDAMLGDVLAGQVCARTGPRDCMLVWQRGLAACDITLAQLALTQALAAGIGSSIDF